MASRLREILAAVMGVREKAAAPRGSGSVYQPTYTDRHGAKKTGARWWISFPCRCCPQNKHREGSWETKADARRELNVRLGKRARGQTLFGSDRVTFDDLEAMVVADYENSKRPSLPAVKRRLRCLRKVFGGWKVAEITTDAITAYSAERQKGAAPATVNLELAALKRGFSLAIRASRLESKPFIPMLVLRNTRKGFFYRPEFDAVIERLPEDLRPLMEAAYITGWRVRSELTTRQWRHVDFHGGWLRLEPHETKNGDGRMFPLSPRLRALLEAQRERTSILEQATGRIIPWVFWRHRGKGVVVEGTRISQFPYGWHRACAEAGVPGRIPHDLRRTAVLNLERAGVARSVAKKITGHKTDSVYNRYAIEESSLLEDAGAKLEALFDKLAGARSVVVKMPTAR